MHADPTFHHIGLVSCGIILLSLGLMLRTWGSDQMISLSGHAARQRYSYSLFATALTTGGGLFYVFALRWLVPTLHLSAAFSVVLALATGCELLAAFVPDSGGMRSLIHRWGAWTMAVLMLVLVGLLFAAPRVVGGAKLAAGVLGTCMLLDFYLFLFVKRSRRYFLIFQSSYIVSFYVAILSVTYLR